MLIAETWTGDQDWPREPGEVDETRDRMSISLLTASVFDYEQLKNVNLRLWGAIWEASN